MRKKTAEDYVSLAKREGVDWLRKRVPANTHTKTWWKCANGHEFDAPYKTLNQGIGCRFCGVERRVERVKTTPEEYRKVASERGFTWIGPEVKNNRCKTNWKCGVGHSWPTTIGVIKRGFGCPHCSGNARKSQDDYHALAKKLGIEWLGPAVKNNNTYTNWRCSCGYIWATSYHGLGKVYGCLVCAGRLPKSPKDYRAIAEKENLEWLGPEVSNSQTKTGWRCNCGYEWKSSYVQIGSGYKCLSCAGKLPKTKTDYEKLANERGFEWAGKKIPSNCHSKTVWSCGSHTWEAPYSDVYSGSGCPGCINLVNGKRISKVQEELAKLVGGELNYEFGRCRIDVALFVKNQKIAIEYDSWYWHDGAEAKDAERDREMIGEGWKILRVKSNTLLPTLKRIMRSVAQLVSGSEMVEIILEDWGQGNSFKQLQEAKFRDK